MVVQRTPPPVVRRSPVHRDTSIPSTVVQRTPPLVRRSPPRTDTSIPSMVVQRTPAPVRRSPDRPDTSIPSTVVQRTPPPVIMRSPLRPDTSITNTLPSSGQKHRLDPASRTDRLMSLELTDLRKKHATLSKDLKELERQLQEVEVSRKALKDESDGWASECASLEQTIADIKTQHAEETEKLKNVTAGVEFKLTHYKLDADERQWRLLAQRKANAQVEADLLYCKNEATYHSHRAHEAQAEAELQRDDLRVRLLVERKRSDMLLERLQAMKSQQLQKKAKPDPSTALRAENERLIEELAEAKAEAVDLRKQLKAANKSSELADLRQKLEEAEEELEAKTEKEQMMAETRKNWKQERKELQATIKELEAQVKRAPPPSKARKALSEDEDDSASAAEDLTPPPSPPPVKKAAKKTAPSLLLEAKRRKPMQGASDAGPSDFDVLPSPKPIKKAAAPSLLGRSAATVTKKKSAWRDDSPEPAPKKKAAAPAPKPAKKTKASIPDYDELLADPSATPMIRSKRTVLDEEEEERAPEDSFRRMPASTRPLAKDKTNTEAAAPQVKKKRKLLGGNKALNWGGDENAAMQPEYNIPLELSPVKPLGNGRARYLSSLGGRGPFG